MLGRFITPDTVVQAPGNPQTLNRYTYCNNNPVNLVDPSGHSWFSKFFKNLFKDLKAIVSTVLSVIAIAVAIIVPTPASPWIIASASLNLVNNGTSSWQGGGWNTFHQIVGYAAIATAVVGAYQSFTAMAGSASATGQAGGAAGGASVGNAAASGSGVAANAPYYQVGDLVKAFNSMQADVFDKVAYAGQIMNQASEAANLAADAQGLQDTWSPFDFVGGVGGLGREAGTIAVGETATRVATEAGKIGAEIFVPSAEKLSTEQLWSENESWLIDKLNVGYKVADFGLDTARTTGRGIFYPMENETIAEWSSTTGKRVIYAIK